MSWVLLARVEDDASFFPDGMRLDSKIFKEMVETYDPEFRTAPVISGFNPITGEGGPAHTTGEVLRPLGTVRSLDFDGFNLWGEIEEFEDKGVGRVSQLVADGFLQRSIGLWPNSPEVGGKAYLKHLAILGAEPPGVPNMPALDSFFTNENVDEATARIIDGAPYLVRSILNPEEQENMADNDQLLVQIRDVFKEALTEVVSSLGEHRTAPEDPTPEPTPEPPSNDEATSILEELRSLRDEAKDEAKTRRNETIDRKLDDLVRDGHLQPSYRDSEKEVLLQLDRTAQDKRIETLSKRSPILPSRLTDSLIPDEVESEADININDYVPPGGDMRNLHGESFAMFQESLKRCDGNMEEFRAAAYALHGERPGVSN